MSPRHFDPRTTALLRAAFALLERDQPADAWATLSAYQEQLELQEDQLPEHLYRACSLRANLLAGMILLRQGEDHAAYIILKSALLSADQLMLDD
jgi:hypothetical protein